MAKRRKFDELIAKMSPEARARVAVKTKRLRQEIDLAELRRAMALSQEDLAKKLGVGQPEVAKIEKRTDMLLSTLGTFLNAAGAHLKIIASFPDHEVQIRNLGMLARQKDREKHPARSTEETTSETRVRFSGTVSAER